MMKYFTLILCALLFVACGGDTDATDTDENRVESEDITMTDPDPTATVASTLEAAERHGSNLTAIPLDMAAENIDIWINRLRGKEGTETVIRELESLRSTLASGSIDGAAVAVLLRSLADETRKVAGGKEDAGRLVEALKAGASRLEGSDENSDQ